MSCHVSMTDCIATSASQGEPTALSRLSSSGTKPLPELPLLGFLRDVLAATEQAEVTLMISLNLIESSH